MGCPVVNHGLADDDDDDAVVDVGRAASEDGSGGSDVDFNDVVRAASAYGAF